MNFKRWNKIIVLASIFLFLPQFTLAHPGRTDSSGCHTCRTNCPSWGLSTGEYHCHRSKGVSQPVEPIKSTYGEGGTGYTTPAPEYETPTINTSNTNINSASVGNTNQAPKVELQTTEKKDSWFRKLLRIFGI